MGVLNRYQRDIPATRASVIYMIEPVIAALFAVMVDGEPMTARKVLGGAVIVAGNLACELMGRRAPEEKTA
jgi:drug/metabolite transporter (DMT)-like permease